MHLAIVRKLYNQQAAAYFHMKITHIPINEETRKVDINAMRRAINKNTCVVSWSILEHSLFTILIYSKQPMPYAPQIWKRTFNFVAGWICSTISTWHYWWYSGHIWGNKFWILDMHCRLYMYNFLMVDLGTCEWISFFKRNLSININDQFKLRLIF